MGLDKTDYKISFDGGGPRNLTAHEEQKFTHVIAM